MTRVRACLNVFTQQLWALANTVNPQLTSLLALERHGIREVFSPLHLLLSLLIGILRVILYALFWMACIIRPPWYLLPLLGGSAQYLALA